MTHSPAHGDPRLDFEMMIREESCSAKRRVEVSERLEAIRIADQADREGELHPQMHARDAERRAEIAGLFADGCLSTGRDFHTAALVYQHGTVPEHYYQAYVWARLAVELGDETASWLIPRAIDRYLINRGYKQLFATNIVTESMLSRKPSDDGHMVWCVWPNVTGISDSDRMAFGVSTLESQVDWARSMNEGVTGPPDGICEFDLPDPPKGLFPGIW